MGRVISVLVPIGILAVVGIGGVFALSAIKPQPEKAEEARAGLNVFAEPVRQGNLTLVVESANIARVPMPMAAAAREAFSQARARGFGGTDFSGMLDAACDANGLTPPRLPHNSRHRV